MEFAFQYIYYFTEHLVVAWPILVLLALIIAFLGLIVGMLESWSRFDSIYWAFITASTVGYGDFRPLQRFSKFLSILIALVGVTFTGILVALAINAATLSFSEVHFPGDPLKTVLQP
jgi:voltage-gated potassium channel